MSRALVGVPPLKALVIYLALCLPGSGAASTTDIEYGGIGRGWMTFSRLRFLSAAMLLRASGPRSAFGIPASRPHAEALIVVLKPCREVEPVLPREGSHMTSDWLEVESFKLPAKAPDMGTYLVRSARTWERILHLLPCDDTRLAQLGQGRGDNLG
ncbi:hypothetical protein F4780DRAFT_613541 [Xylariomycetidae sp. FL0641]|nr:hypothetical protein F4780DRAFT_613541 [Xylariomycetidae sp. FL0641]